MERFARFFDGFQQDLKAYAYWCIIFTIFRFAFIATYSSQIEGLFTVEVAQSMWLGLRLSLKTTGLLMLIGVFVATLPSVVFKKWKADKIRYAWHGIALVFFSILFFIRVPYYKIFNNTFDMRIVNGLHDDKYAILMTAINEYQMLWRLPIAIVIGIVLAYMLRLIFKTPVIKFVNIRAKKVVAIATILFIPTFWIFTRYGGSFNYANSINWESAGRTRFNLLNEAVLDDGQALYRVYSIKRKLAKDASKNVTIEELKRNIVALGGNIGAATIDKAFERTVISPKISKQPNNVILIVGETFGIWPFINKFQDLGLVRETTKLQESDNGFAVENMLPGANLTMLSMNVMLTGLPNVGIYDNLQPNSYQTEYQMGIGYVMKKMGYKTVFWYGGFGSWQNYRNFCLQQSFDEFHCADEFKYTGGNAWGCPDRALFEEINKYVAKQGDEKVFHLILTTSNHAPYTIDVDSEGFNRREVLAKLPVDIQNDEKTINELGHMWYMDNVLGAFVKTTEKIIPNSLFVITGDHSERLHFAKEQEIRTRASVPCIFYGAGINKAMFKDLKVGAHNQIAGTIAELIAPAGFKYSAIWDNMFNSDVAFNYYLYADENSVYKLDDNDSIKKLVEFAKLVSTYRIVKGNSLQYE